MKTTNLNLNSSILRIALLTKYTNEQIDDILEIVNATPNAEVATSILLGVYVAPEIPETCKDTRSEINRKFMSYNKYTDTVTYSYNRVRNKEAYFLKEDEPIEANIKANNNYSSSAAQELGISTDTLYEKYQCKIYDSVVSDTISDSYMSLTEWIKQQS